MAKRKAKCPVEATAAGVGRIQIDDPEHPGSVVRVRINRREDVVGAWLAAGKITTPQHQAAARLRDALERAAAVGYRVVDPERIIVDCSGGTQDHALQAVGLAQTLVLAEAVVGAQAYRWLRWLLADGASAQGIAKHEGREDVRKAVAPVVHAALDELAAWWEYDDSKAGVRRRRAIVARFHNTRNFSC